MMEEAAKAGLPEPVLEEYAGGIQVTFLKTSTETVGETLGKSVEKIIILIKNNPHITQKEMAQQTGLSRRGVEKNIGILKKKGKIKRIGPANGGHWQIIDQKKK
jgi:ATP-dependent DNA helicase RecG